MLAHIKKSMLTNLPSVRIVRLDPDLPLPQYETHGAVGCDLLVRTDTLVPAGGIALIPTGLIVEVPEGYALIVASRSSTPRKKGLTQPHGIGVIDQDYCGPDDELQIQVQNFMMSDVLVKRGEKIAQGLFVRVDRVAFTEVPAIDRGTRGGFGSTGG